MSKGAIMRKCISRKIILLTMAIALTFVFSYAGGQFVDGLNKGLQGIYSYGAEIQDSDWNFDVATGELKGFKDGNKFDNPTDLVIPEKIGGVQVKSIGKEAFKFGKWGGKIKNPLTSLTLPEGLEETKEQAFQSGDKASKVKNVLIPATVKVLGTRTFFGHVQMTEVKFAGGAKLTEIGDEVFYSCYKLKDIIIPETVTRIGVSAFSDTSVKNIKIPETVTEIGDSAFAISLVEEINLPKGIEKFGLKANGKPGTNPVFFRTAKEKVIDEKGYAKQKDLKFTVVHTESDKIDADNSAAVVNPQPVTVNFVDEKGNKVKDSETVVGAETNRVRVEKGQYSSKYFLEKDGDGHYYKDYINPWQEATNIYSKQDFRKAIIGENYFVAGKEYTFKAPVIKGMKAPESQVKTVTKDDHEITFTYKEMPKVQLSVEGEGVTTSPEAGMVSEGSEIEVSIHEPSDLKLKKLTVNGDDVTEKVKFDGIDYTYKFELKAKTKVKAEYKQAKNVLKLNLPGAIKIGKNIEPSLEYRGEVLKYDKEKVELSVSQGKKFQLDKDAGTIFPLEAGNYKVEAKLKKHPEIKASAKVKVNPINVTMRLEDVEKTVLPKTPVTIDKVYLENGKTYYKDYQYKAAAPIFALEKVLRENLKVDTKDKTDFDCGDDGNWMRTLGKDKWDYVKTHGEKGSPDSHMVCVNNKRTTLGVGQWDLSDGDDVLIYYDRDYKAPGLVGYFDKEEYKIMEGENIDLSLKADTYHYSAKLEDPPTITSEKVADAVIEINGKQILDAAKSDENGKLSYKFDKEGTYFVSAVKTGITRPFAKVVVQSKDGVAAENVEKQIEKLGKITKKNAKAKAKEIAAARKAYDKLTTEQKARVKTEVLNNLKNAEKVLKAVKYADKKKARIKKAKKLTVAKLKVKSKSRKIIATWKKTKSATGYKVQYKAKKTSKYKTLKSTKKLKVTSKKLKRKVVYYVRVRTYTVIDSVKYYGKWTKIKKISIK